MDWVQQYDSGLIPSEDVARTMTVDAADNVYVTGTSKYNLGFYPGLASGNLTIIKYTPDGTEAWVARDNGQGKVMIM